MKRQLAYLTLLLVAAISSAQTPGDVIQFRKGSGVADVKTWYTPVNSSLFSLNSSGNFALLAQSNFITTANFNGLGDARWSLLDHPHSASDITSGVFNHARLGTGGGGSTKFLREDGTWQTVATGTGDVVGPASATDNNIPRWDGTTGKLLKNGLAATMGLNGAADAGKVVLFNNSGGLYGTSLSSSVGVSGTSSSGTGVYGSSDSGDGVHASSSTGIALHALSAGSTATVLANGQGTGPSIEVNNQGSGVGLLVKQYDISANIARFIDGTDGLFIGTDGGCGWDDADGAQTTATNLPAFGISTKGVVPASGGGTTNFLRADGSWAAPGGGGGGTWGSITGTLSDQTDLQGQLEGLANAIGAIVVDDIRDAEITTSPSENAVFDALAGKASTSHTHSAADITSGTIATARLGSGTANSGTYLRGDQSWQTLNAAAVGASTSGASVFTLATPATRSLLRYNTDGSVALRTYAEVIADLDVQPHTAALDAVVGTNTGDQFSIVGITGSLSDFNTALTGADFATGGGTATGTNTGDQTSIVGITGTLAQFNTALTGADFATGGGTATGSNTGDQTISITGDVTASGGTGALTATVTKINGTALSGLATGILKNTTTTGVPSIAAAGTDYVAPGGALGTPSSGTLTNCTFPTLNQNTTGSAATLTTSRTIQTDLASTSSASFNGSANITPGVTGVLAIANGGSGSSTAGGALTNMGIIHVGVTNFTFNNASYTNLTGASATLAANTNYSVKCMVNYTTPSTSTGIGVSVTMTGSPTARNLNRAQPVAATGTVVSQVPSDDAGSIATTSLGTTELTAILEGNVLTSGSSSTLQLRVARGGTSNTITILSATILAIPL